MALVSVAHHEPDSIIVGVDTHEDTHTAAILNGRGATVATRQFAASREGYEQLEAWAKAQGQVEAWGIEGTASYGAGLTRFLVKKGYSVREVIRPNRKARRRKGKSDPIDAEAAARAVQAGETAGPPKSGDGPVAIIGMLKVLRISAIRQRTETINQMKALIVVAPDELREELRRVPVPQLIKVCSGWELGPAGDLEAATKGCLGELARKLASLQTQIDHLDALLAPLVASTAPTLVALYGVGTQVAAQLLVTAGDNPDRLSSEGGFAMLCGTGPLEASSGKTKRHRLNRGGDRQANAALHQVVVVRMRWHGPTRAYVQRRLAEGKTKREIMRCLKRYVAREVFAALKPKPAKPDKLAA